MMMIVIVMMIASYTNDDDRIVCVTIYDACKKWGQTNGKLNSRSRIYLGLYCQYCLLQLVAKSAKKNIYLIIDILVNTVNC